jgi:hypothetical protein
MIIPHLIILGMFVTDRQGVRTSDRYHMFFNACGAETASIRAPGRWEETGMTGDPARLEPRASACGARYFITMLVLAARRASGRALLSLDQSKL